MRRSTGGNACSPGTVSILDIPSELPLIYVDPILLEQALGQIIDNAAKYSQPGSTIHSCCESHGASVVLSVKDEGVGLVGEERTRLWERFFRGERHASNVSGSGLGLWIAKAFVTANGGEIEAFSDGSRPRHDRVNSSARNERPKHGPTAGDDE